MSYSINLTSWIAAFNLKSYSKPFYFLMLFRKMKSTPQSQSFEIRCNGWWKHKTQRKLHRNRSRKMMKHKRNSNNSKINWVVSRTTAKSGIHFYLCYIYNNKVNVREKSTFFNWIFSVLHTKNSIKRVFFSGHPVCANINDFQVTSVNPFLRKITLVFKLDISVVLFCSFFQNKMINNEKKCVIYAFLSDTKKPIRRELTDQMTKVETKKYFIFSDNFSVCLLTAYRICIVYNHT